jgi:hypothetical protein
MLMNEGLWDSKDPHTGALGRVFQSSGRVSRNGSETPVCHLPVESVDAPRVARQRAASLVIYAPPSQIFAQPLDLAELPQYLSPLHSVWRADGSDLVVCR